ncbi:XK-related protein 7 [Bombina bombina]|uniref:XK-related protein 7 n=1 Tax=Bombina bombina TaxID=8345 RepID=UPI00235A8EA3|nr:XK-related protein 7 [Bombina bombina]
MAAQSDGPVCSPPTGPVSLPRAPVSSTGYTIQTAASQRYSPRDALWLLAALLVFFSDAASDLWLAVYYLQRRRLAAFWPTVLLAVLPSVLTQGLSLSWAAGDRAGPGERTRGRAERGDKPGGNCCRMCLWVLQTTVHLLQLGQVWRYLHALYLGLQSRWQKEQQSRHFYWRLMFESADISMLRLLETFLKSAPQLVLQLCIVIQQGHVEPLQGLSASASLLSLAWMIASYQKVLRDSRDDKMPMSYKGALVQVLWHLFTIAARALAFSLFASVFHLYFGIFIVTHWCVMTFWIIQGETDFCMSRWEEIIYNMVLGIIYIFCWFNVREGQTRCRMATYYIIALSENAVLTALWYLNQSTPLSDFYALLIVCSIICSFALGIFFMLVYYSLLHPNGPMFGSSRGNCVFTEGPDIAREFSTDGLESLPRTLPRTTVEEGHWVTGDRNSCAPVFQVRSSVPHTPVTRLPSIQGPVIRIDLPRKKYPAWDAHFIDRRLRKSILTLEYSSSVTPRVQYRSLGAAHEVTEYETTV